MRCAECSTLSLNSSDETIIHLYIYCGLDRQDITMAEEWKEWLESIVTETEEKARKKLAKKIKKYIKSLIASQGSESVEEPEEKPVKKESKKAEEKKEKESSESKKDNKATSSETPAAKKVKLSQESEVEVDQSDARSEKTEASKTQSTSSSRKNGSNSERKRFQRVDEEKALQKAIILDNTYEATFGSEGYGAKANEKLRQVRGKDFRHEKTKKKRGSYRGGAIDENAVRSIDFDSD